MNMKPRKQKPTTYPLTREQAEVALTLAAPRIRTEDLTFWQATQRDFAEPCWHWEVKGDSEKWGVVYMDSGHRITVSQYGEARDMFTPIANFSALKVYNQIKFNNRRNSDEEKSQ